MSTRPHEQIRPITGDYFEVDEYPTIHVDLPGGNMLDFCGIVHANNPDDPNDKYMLDRVKSEVGAFLDTPSDREKLVLLEGWKGPRTEMDGLPEDQLVRRGGEEALADRMVRSAGVEIASPEPPAKDEFEQLCQEFPPDQVFYWYVARQAVQWGREHPVTEEGSSEYQERGEVIREKFDMLTERLTETLGHPPTLENTASALDAITETHRQLFDNELDWDDIGHFAAHANPIDDNSVINKIHNRSNQIRDEYIFHKIEKATASGKDVFAVYGDGHAYTLEPALRALGRDN